jgi:hypothetical protein
MSTHDDFEVEPAPGIPARLPEGETVLWQGAPDWRRLAWRSFHLRYIVAYFAVLAGWTGFSTWWVGGGMPMAMRSVVPVSVAGIVAVSLLALVAWLVARSTVYTVTSKRVLMRFGVALPMTFNLPFSCLKGAAIRRFPDGSGDLSLTMEDEANQLNALVMWPHARPWHLRQPQPSFRALPDLDSVAGILTDALKAVHPTGEATTIAAPVRVVTRPEAPMAEASHLASAAR